MYKHKCEFCGKCIYTNRIQRHINICQSQKIHVFCGKECKRNWVSSVYSGRLKVKKPGKATT